ncbi:hypothetical protein GDO81_011379 [Engystomops pustulosus]|uniref:Uncharacterized protein n=1 Tax=Engystomops pustulosus TaxID=76066 RepID=A0AAV7BDU2_ENGPU|nr:hypothetical protein GDO81_011379 [Engystomops pustulosus]
MEPILYITLGLLVYHCMRTRFLQDKSIPFGGVLLLDVGPKPEPKAMSTEDMLPSITHIQDNQLEFFSLLILAKL